MGTKSLYRFLETLCCIAEDELDPNRKQIKNVNGLHVYSIILSRKNLKVG